MRLNILFIPDSNTLIEISLFTWNQYTVLVNCLILHCSSYLVYLERTSYLIGSVMYYLKVSNYLTTISHTHHVEHLCVFSEYPSVLLVCKFFFSRVTNLTTKGIGAQKDQIHILCTNSSHGGEIPCCHPSIDFK